MNTGPSPYPTTIKRYLDELRKALAGSDPALVQDALYDAEDYLRSEMSENPGKSEAEIIAMVAGSYGSPDEVADIYRDTEAKVQTALRAPAPRWTTPWGKFFGVAADSRSYGALFYMLLAIVPGIFYFTCVAVGMSLSLGLSVLIIGIPVIILYFGIVRVLSLAEGRLVEAMLGVRMPRRPLYASRDGRLVTKIKGLFTDPRIWSTHLYFLLMLPLGIAYFTIFVTLIALVVSLVGLPAAVWTGLATGDVTHDSWSLLHIQLLGVDASASSAELLLCLVIGVLLMFGTLHLARGIGYLHGLLAKHLLVAPAR
jgi:putative sensor protein/HAAS domain-containing protein